MNQYKILRAVLCYAALLIGFSLLSSCGGSSSGGSRTAPTAEENITLNPWESAIQRYEELDQLSPPHPKNPIVVLGSSSILLWAAIDEDLAPLPIISRGFGGSTMKDAVYYADRIVTVYNPAMVVIYEGDNDIAFGLSPEDFLETYITFIEKIRIRLPDVPIYFISIKPSIVRWNLWEKSVNANTEIKMYSLQDPLLRYIDVASAMLEEESDIRQELFINDGLHMNRLGYEVWTEVIRPVLMNDYQRLLTK